MTAVPVDRILLVDDLGIEVPCFPDTNGYSVYEIHSRLSINRLKHWQSNRNSLMSNALKDLEGINWIRKSELLSSGTATFAFNQDSEQIWRGDRDEDVTACRCALALGRS